MVGAHGRRDEDFPGEVELGFKGSRGRERGEGLHRHTKWARPRREDEGGKERKTQKSSLIRFPGYHDLECHLSRI